MYLLWLKMAGNFAVFGKNISPIRSRDNIRHSLGDFQHRILNILKLILNQLHFRTTKVILAVLSSSIICGMPNAVVNVVTCIKMSSSVLTPSMYSASLTTNAIVYLGSCLNPMIYTLGNNQLLLFLRGSYKVKYSLGSL